MNLIKIIFDLAESINIFISTVIGLFLSYFAAYTYEGFTNKRKKKSNWEKFHFLESRNQEFDWQHWEIINGKIDAKPINSYMCLHYSDDMAFNLQWIESIGGRVEGYGKLIFDDTVRGKMFFFSVNSIMYDYRDFFYREIEHLGTKYDGLFINAKDQGTNYVMLRKSCR